jgi:hypothetical protein
MNEMCRYAVFGALFTEPPALPGGGVQPCAGSSHLDVVLEIHYRPGLGDDGLPRVQGNHDGLEVIADDLVIDHVSGYRNDP